MIGKEEISMKYEHNVVRRKKTIILAAVLCFLTAILASGYPETVRAESGTAERKSTTSAATSADSAVKKKKAVTGWKTMDGKKYYYKNGVKSKGWVRIRGNYYYFNKKGVLLTNQIVGSRSKGYYYVDKTGTRVTAKEIKAAVSFVMSHSSSRQTDQQRLTACFWALCRYPYQRIYGDKPSKNTISSYAAYMFTRKQGNCYRYASALAYIARVLGYDSRVAVGGVTARTYGSLSPHGWCEVKIGDTWKVCDCSMQRAYSTRKLFLVNRNTYPFRLRCDHVYRLSSKNGRILWK